MTLPKLQLELRCLVECLALRLRDYILHPHEDRIAAMEGVLRDISRRRRMLQEHAQGPGQSARGRGLDPGPVIPGSKSSRYRYRSLPHIFATLAKACTHPAKEQICSEVVALEPTRR